MSTDTAYKNFAFISYSHRDMGIARWLQKKLEQFRLPAKIHNDIEVGGKYIRPIFRDESDLSTGYLSDMLAENFRSPDYEEFLSIGIIAIQVMVKNKTEKQLAKYTDLYISTAMRWAIRNEMRIRYDWYALKYGNLDEVSTEAMKKYEDAGIDATKGYVRVSIYNTVKDIYYLVQSKDINSLSSVFVEKAEDGYDFYSSEIMRMATVVFASRDKISPENRDCYDYIFSKDSNVEELHRRFTPKTIKSMLDEVKKALDDSGLRGA